MIRAFFLGLCLLTVSCASQVKLDPVVQTAPPVAVPSAAPLVLNQVQWKVLNTDDLKALIAQNGSKDVVIFALDPDSFQNLKLNMVEITRYITDQKTIEVLLKKVVNQDSGVVSATKAPPTTATKE